MIGGKKVSFEVVPKNSRHCSWGDVRWQTVPGTVPAFGFQQLLCSYPHCHCRCKVTFCCHLPMNTNISKERRKCTSVIHIVYSRLELCFVDVVGEMIISVYW